MTFASQDGRWWCNACLAYREGDAPADAPPPAPRFTPGGPDPTGERIGWMTGSFLDFTWLLLLGAGIAIGLYLAS